MNLLLQKLKNEMVTSIEFMEGREQGQIMTGVEHHINNFAFLKNEEGEYAVFTIKEDDTKFFFGASIVTDKLKKVKNILSEDELTDLLSVGLPVVFDKKKAEKSKRVYTDMTINF